MLQRFYGMLPRWVRCIGAADVWQAVTACLLATAGSEMFSPFGPAAVAGAWLLGPFPFAALTGYEEAVEETARLTEPRPELDEEEALEDLRMMAKQGAGLAEMRQVMESMLCVLPTPRMISALNQLHLQTVRWIGMPSAVLN